MPTVKRKASGAIITKAGKVSCGCCNPPLPGDCCMYDAQKLVDGICSAADLPAAITFIGVGSLAKSGTNYGDTTNGVILESGNWATYRAGVRATQFCLIDEDVQDQFDPCYKIFLQSPYSSETYIDTLTRKTVCRWDNIIGFNENGSAILNNAAYYVELRFNDGIQRWLADLYGVPFYFEKSPPQDTPIGSYPSEPIYPGGPSYIVTVQSC